jgi:hypothetical protein
MSALFVLGIFLFKKFDGESQSTNPDDPTLIASLPIRGTLSSGTYYYRVPEAMVREGAATASLSFTPPDGGGSLTASFSGRRCCEGEATVGESTGYSGTIRRFSTFSIPAPQDLLVTIYVSVAVKHSIHFDLSLSATGGSGIIVTGPSPSPSPSASRILPPAAVCTDLAVVAYTVTGETGLRKEISGQVINVTTTHPYKGYRRLQWVEVLDITDSEKLPRTVARVMIPEIIEPRGIFSYSAIHTLTTPRRTRYKMKIVYSPYNATDRSQYNDDCNPANNSTTRQVVGILTAPGT